MLVIKTLETPKIKLLLTHTGTNSSFLSTLKCAVPYYQAGLGNRLCYEITFNDYNRVIKSAVASPDAKYEISNISLEYEIVTQPALAKHISDEYQNMVLLYDRIFRHRKCLVNKSDTTWNWSFNTPCKSLKGILVLFEEEKPYERDIGKFYNPKIEKSLLSWR